MNRHSFYGPANTPRQGATFVQAPGRPVSWVAGAAGRGVAPQLHREPLATSTWRTVMPILNVKISAAPSGELVTAVSGEFAG
jgi:hypothetical protein